MISEKIKQHVAGFAPYGFLALFFFGVDWLSTLLFGGHTQNAVYFILPMVAAYWWNTTEEKRAKETYDLRERIRRVEKSLQKLDEQYAYKIDVSVIPDWSAIFAKLYGSKNWHDEFDEATKEDYHNPEKAGRSIAWQQFRFVEFFDSTNYGLGMLWSDYRKSFVYDYEVWGSILADDSLAARKMADAMGIKAEEIGAFAGQKTLPIFRVSPNGISSRPYCTAKDKETVASFADIPFERIKNVMTDATKKDLFPADIQNALREAVVGSNIEYRCEANDEYSFDYGYRPDTHVFKGEYHELRIHLTMASRPLFCEA